ncbi:MAG: HK97 family phage prohead protease [Ilumatobacteraceae bacterium]
MTALLTRSFGSELATDGRTLEGLAFRWDVASKVSDGGPSYLEAFTRGSTDKTLKERGPRPLGFLHPWTPGAKTDPMPLGAVTFRAGTEGLEFSAKVSKTRNGDEMLELVNDGAVTDVSIGFRSFKEAKRGTVVYRTEIGLEELSLIPTGFGAHTGAEVLAVRAIDLGAPRLDELRRKLVLL